MADDALKRGEAISKFMSTPRVYWYRKADTLATDTELLMPIYVASAACTVSNFILTSATWGSGTRTYAGLELSHYRYGSQLASLTTSILPGWAASIPHSVWTPNWTLEIDDVITVSVTKTGVGYLLPDLALALELTL
jgi:hypothetical protein